jgi:hypothetical protein
MLASGKPLLVQADPGTELHGFLEGAAILAPAGDAAALAEALQSCTSPCERAAELRQGLAMELSAGKILPDFRRVLAA